MTDPDNPPAETATEVEDDTAGGLAPWQVWWTEFTPQVGREQAGRRPAIVVGSAFACALPNHLAFVVPCTSTDRGLPFHPPVTLDRPSFALCDQLKSISRNRLRRRHPTHLDPHEVEAIKFVLRQMIDIR